MTKINQDYYVIETNINGIKNFNLFGVLDGHGLYGHLISLFVGRYIVETFINHKEIKSCKDLDELYFKVKYNNFGIINDLFINAEKELYKEEFDSNFSGTTCIIVFQIGENLICANSGDSRAILIYNEKERLLLNNNENNNTTSNNNKSPDKDINYYQIKNIIEPFSSFGKNFKSLFKRISSLSSKDIKRLRRFTQKITLIKKPNNFQKSDTRIFNLSNDLKPTLPLEKKRILENGGRVEQYIEDDGAINSPFRVWVQDEMYPGLAMSRSIGDFIASSVGVIPNPEIIEYNLNKSSKYMVIASDGIWQFMSNEKVMDIGNKYYPKKLPSKGIRKDLYYRTPGLAVNVSDIELIKHCEKYFAEYMCRYREIKELRTIEYVNLAGVYRKLWYAKAACFMKTFVMVSIFIVVISLKFGMLNKLFAVIGLIIIFGVLLSIYKHIDLECLYKIGIRCIYDEWGYYLTCAGRSKFVGTVQMIEVSKFHKYVHSFLDIAALCRAVAFSDHMSKENRICIITRNLSELFTNYTEYEQKRNWVMVIPLWIAALFEFYVSGEISAEIKATVLKSADESVRADISIFLQSFWADMERKELKDGILDYIQSFETQLYT